MIKVFIADDHPLVRHGLRVVLSATSDCQATGEAATSAELIDKLGQAECDVLVLDLRMPGKSGMELFKQAKALRPDLPILIFSMHAEDNLAFRLLRAGAAGYLSKQYGPAELLEAVRRLATGRRYLSPHLAERLVVNLEPDRSERPPHENLSDREYQVASLLGSAWTITSIAQHLHLSIKTVSTYRRRVMEKLGLHTNSELIRYMLEHPGPDLSLVPPRAQPPEALERLGERVDV